MKKLILPVLLALCFLLVRPVSIYAADCEWSIFSLILGCEPLGGIRETTEQVITVQSHRDVEVQRIQSQADLQIEQARQQGVRDQAMFDAYKVMVQEMARKEINEVDERYAFATSALQNQTDLGLNSLLEAGDTSRHRIAWESRVQITKSLGGSAVALLLILVVYQLAGKHLRGGDRAPG